MKSRTAALSGWGRYPVAECAVYNPGSAGALADTIDGLPDAIVRGNGRSYGDASLNPAATIEALGLDRLIAFESETGTLTCEAGVLLSDIIDVLLPRGWFPAVTPGTRFVSVGGAIASDVHGKNHHGAGSFCDHLDWLDLAPGDGSVLRCSREENADLFAATCGGMGLTGAILRAAIRLTPVESAWIRQKKVRAKSLATAFEIFEGSLDWTYSVAWIDCLAKGDSLGRSVVFLGEHARLDELPERHRAAPFARPSSRPKRVPIDFPGFALSRVPVTLFNAYTYASNRDGEGLADLDRYFYPLDSLLDWNRIYGRRGFMQYQCVLPLKESEQGIRRLLDAITSAGSASFLAVLKRMGPASFGLLSFPMEGYTLALDFPHTPANLALLDNLDSITREHGGRIYFAKDSRGRREALAFYPGVEAFRNVRAANGLHGRVSSLMSDRLGL